MSLTFTKQYFCRHVPGILRFGRHRTGKQISISASLVIWFTITEYFPLYLKGSVGIFEGPHLFGQFRLVSSVRVSEGC